MIGKIHISNIAKQLNKKVPEFSGFIQGAEEYAQWCKRSRKRLSRRRAPKNPDKGFLRPKIDTITKKEIVQ